MFFFKQKTAYDMRISDWSSDVCSSDLDSARVIKSSACAAGKSQRHRVGAARRYARYGTAPGALLWRRCAIVAESSTGLRFEDGSEGRDGGYCQRGSAAGRANLKTNRMNGASIAGPR